jgi:hypothetical protein
MACLACGRDLHDECNPPNDCCCGPVTKEASVPRRVGRPIKDDRTLVDPKSTWRKRATEKFPLDKEADCEWRLRANCGGGKYPIVGCSSGKQSAIHHGPVKILDDTEFEYDFNQTGNVHRLCHRCHTLWHHWNDVPFDPGTYSSQPHSPRNATPDELLLWGNATTRPKAPEPRTGPMKKDED